MRIAEARRPGLVRFVGPDEAFLGQGLKREHTTLNVNFAEQALPVAIAVAVGGRLEMTRRQIIATDGVGGAGRQLRGATT